LHWNLLGQALADPAQEPIPCANSVQEGIWLDDRASHKPESKKYGSGRRN
jgi:hypothetical protein